MTRQFDAIFIIFSYFLLSYTCSENNDQHNGESNQGGGGNDHGKLTVIISFDSMNSQSQEFFTSEIQPIYEEFSKCVQWNFIPCSTSQIIHHVLHCENGAEECKIDQLHACAAHMYQKDQNKLGKFFICMMTGRCQYKQGESCAKAAGLDWGKLKTCQSSKEAAKWCDNMFNKLWDLGEPVVPGIIYDWKYNKKEDEASYQSLKSEICKQLKKRHMQCCACGNSSGGGGGHHNGGN